MRAEHILALLAAATLTACGSSEPGFFERTMPTARAANEPARGIEEIDSIPVDELSTSGSTALDESTPCASVPREVVAPAGFTGPPVADDWPGCVWLSADNLVLTVSSVAARSMAEAVADHERMAPDLSHLTWLRVDEPRKAAEAFCPTARQVAQNLLRHLDPR